MAVAAAVIAWFAASNVYVEMRAANVFDELYYSTLDARSSYVLLQEHVNPAVLASIFGARKSDPPQNKGLEDNLVYGRRVFDDLNSTNRSIYIFSYPRIRGAGGVKQLWWYVEDGSDEGRSILDFWNNLYPSGKCLVLLASVYPENIGGSGNPSDYSSGYCCAWVYDIDSKELSRYHVDPPSQYSNVRTRYASEAFELDGADPLFMIDCSRQAIRDVILRDYLEGAGLPEDEVESKLAAVDPIIDDAAQRARAIYQNGEDE